MHQRCRQGSSPRLHSNWIQGQVQVRTEIGLRCYMNGIWTRIKDRGSNVPNLITGFTHGIALTLRVACRTPLLCAGFVDKSPALGLTVLYTSTVTFWQHYESDIIVMQSRRKPQWPPETPAKPPFPSLPSSLPSLPSVRPFCIVSNLSVK